MFKASANNALGGPVNSVQVYFSIPNIVPEGGEMTISLETGGDGVLEHSIITNLPV